MAFALTNNPSQSEISNAINYLLANFGPNLSADPNTGQITGPSGIVLAYLYRYLAVKYADSFDGTLNFSNSPTNRGYYGVNNRNSNVESTNPADYIWFKVAGGFGTIKFLYYQTTGGRSINFIVALFPPNSTYIQDSGIAIDLDNVTSSTPSAVSATTAYRVQNQADPAPTGFPQTTIGSTIPVGFTAVLGAVTVGQVVWYTFGKYNPSNIATIDGVPPNSTYWSVPIAASIFQDIRSDNWNGSTPPVYGTPATYGTQGYYISRTTGNVYFNNGVYRGDINTDGDAVFTGNNETTVPIFIYDGNYKIDYSAYGIGNTDPIFAFTARTGVFGSANANISPINAGVIGYAKTPGGTLGGVGIGVIGSADNMGGFFSPTSPGGIGLACANVVSTGVAFQITKGKFSWNGYSIPQPAGSTTTFLRNDGTWSTVDADSLGGYVASSWARIFPTNSGNANAAGAGINILGSTSTGIVGAYVATSGAGNTVTIEVTTTSPSDIRLKEEIADSDLGLAFVKKLRPVSYKLKADPKHQKGYGFIADEVDQIIESGSSLVYHEPDWKVGDEVGFKTIHYPSYVAVLTKAIQELAAEVQALKSQIKV